MELSFLDFLKKNEGCEIVLQVLNFLDSSIIKLILLVIGHGYPVISESCYVFILKQGLKLEKDFIFNECDNINVDTQ